jgi:hypothetical protein
MIARRGWKEKKTQFNFGQASDIYLYIALTKKMPHHILSNLENALAMTVSHVRATGGCTNSPPTLHKISQGTDHAREVEVI